MRERIENIDLSIRKISEKASKQEDVVRFDIGQPSFDTPEHIKEAAKNGLENKQGYSPMLGLEELREEIAEEEEETEEETTGDELNIDSFQDNDLDIPAFLRKNKKL